MSVSGASGQSLYPQGHLDHDFGELVRRLADRPAPVGGLAPGGPVHRDVGPDPRRLLLAREAVGGLPRDVAQEHVHLEALLDRLALEQRLVEGPADGTDDVDEDVIEHGGERLPGSTVTIAFGERTDRSWLELDG
jgi:hypothetical protein